MSLKFGVTWEYRCPFARNAHEHLITGLRHGADWEVSWLPFSLGQAHVAEGETDVWDEPSKDSGILALQAGVVVRDEYPDQFLDVHEALFAARHDRALDLKDPEVIRTVLTEHGVEADAVFERIAGGEPLAAVRKEHEAGVNEYAVFGVPTFIAGDSAVFVRFMHRPEGDGDVAVQTIERAVGLQLGWPELNEFKHTQVKR